MLAADACPTPLFPDDDRQVLILEAGGLVRSWPRRAALVWRGVAGLLRARSRQRLTGEDVGRRLRDTLEGLGGLWVKLGQLVSLRIDLFGPEFCGALGQLQDRAVGFPGADAAAIVEAELGRPLDAVFAEFDLHPVAAASIGQVHRARLRDGGIEVAVKVQRPGMARTFERQLRLIRRIAWLMCRLGVAPYLQWDAFAWELEQVVREEVDYRFEAANTRRMRRTLARHGIVAPRVFEQYSTTRVLTASFLRGALMADYITLALAAPARAAAWRRENGIDASRVAHALSYSLLRQIFEDNLFHGDLHPGNVMLLRDNRIALLDFGSVSSTEREYLDKFRLSSRAFATRDYAKAADLTLQLCQTLPAADPEPLQRDIVRAIYEWARRSDVTTLAYHQKSLNAFYSELARVLIKYRCPNEWAFLRIRRAQETLDASLLVLNPGGDPAAMAETYFAQASRRAARAGGRTYPARVAHALVGADETLGRFGEIAALQVDLVRRRAKIFGRRAGRTARVGAWIASVVVIAACAAALALATAWAGVGLGAGGEIAALREWDPQVRLVLAAVSMLLALTAWRARRRLRDVGSVVSGAAVRV
jgi:ubiquinone biosynthesis protein